MIQATIRISSDSTHSVLSVEYGIGKTRVPRRWKRVHQVVLSHIENYTLIAIKDVLREKMPDIVFQVVRENSLGLPDPPLTPPR